MTPRSFLDRNTTEVSPKQAINSHFGDTSVISKAFLDRAVFGFLSDSQATTDLEDGLRGDAVEFADGADCGAVVDGNSAEGIT